MRRVLTALVLAPAVAYIVVGAPQWAFLVVLSAVALLCFYEYSGIAAGYGIEKPGPVGYAAGMVLLLTPLDPVAVVTLIGLLALCLTLWAETFPKGLPRAAALVLGVVYVFGSWKCAIGLRQRSVWWLLFALVLNWVGDIAAYYVGRAIGKHKLAPRVSPGKSWEGAVASVVASAAFGAWYMGQFMPQVGLGAAIGISAAANIAGQFGDLSESALKRGAGVKDSSNLLPGHGGWLDRVDSSLFSLPVVYWVVQFLH
jgi:phosphatidate cytidylyltransferase